MKEVATTILLARCCWPDRKNGWTNFANSTALSATDGKVAPIFPMMIAVSPPGLM